jgi:Right handed beta helix region
VSGAPVRAALGAVSILCVLLAPDRAVAATLHVGPHRALKLPSAAAAVAAPGDRIELDAGRYSDCAVWSAPRLTIEGRDGGAVIEGTPCDDKALFVIRGDDITVRNVEFVGARVPDGNGAGIRLEGKNLTVDRSRFVENENGILAGNAQDSRLLISHSEFLRNGKCDPVCAHGVYVGRLALLRIEESSFVGTREGHHIKSRARRTELVGNRISDGDDGTASYLVDLPNGGSLVMHDNELEKGPRTGNHTAAVMIGAEGVTQPTDELVFTGNRFTSDYPGQTTFVTNLTKTEPVLVGNVLTGRITPLSGQKTGR